MTPPHPRSTLFPYTTLFRSADENLAIDAEEVFAFHALLSRNAADEQCPVHTAKTFLEVGGRNNTFEERESAVIEFHDNAAKRSEEHTSELQSRRDLVCRLLL